MLKTIKVVQEWGNSLGIRLSKDELKGEEIHFNDEVVVLLKKSIDVEKARTGLMNIYKLTKLQADAILDMKLSKLISLEQEKINKEYDELLVLILNKSTKNEQP